jgi:hypothetical protein
VLHPFLGEGVDPRRIGDALVLEERAEARTCSDVVHQAEQRSLARAPPAEDDDRVRLERAPVRGERQEALERHAELRVLLGQAHQGFEDRRSLFRGHRVIFLGSALVLDRLAQGRVVPPEEVGFEL